MWRSTIWDQPQSSVKLCSSHTHFHIAPNFQHHNLSHDVSFLVFIIVNWTLSDLLQSGGTLNNPPFSVEFKQHQVSPTEDFNSKDLRKQIWAGLIIIPFETKTTQIWKMIPLNTLYVMLLKASICPVRHWKFSLLTRCWRVANFKAWFETVAQNTNKWDCCPIFDIIWNRGIFRFGAKWKTLVMIVIIVNLFAAVKS